MHNFNPICDTCYHVSDPFCGPGDAISHKRNCPKIGNDKRHKLWINNSIEAGTIRRNKDGSLSFRGTDSW